MSRAPVITRCPACAGPLAVARLVCPRCDTAVEGRFSAGPFAALTPEQLAFVEAFVVCEGKLKSMEAELGISYPTVRARLHEIIRALGHEPGGRDTAVAMTPDERRQILEDLEAGLIDMREAMRALNLTHPNET